MDHRSCFPIVTFYILLSFTCTNWISLCVTIKYLSESEKFLFLKHKWRVTIFNKKGICHRAQVLVNDPPAQTCERSSICPCVSANCPLMLLVHGARGYPWWALQRRRAPDLPPGFVPSGENSISTDKGSWLWRRSVNFNSQIRTDDWSSCARVTYSSANPAGPELSPLPHMDCRACTLALVHALKYVQTLPIHLHTHTHTPLARRGRSLRNRLCWNSISCEDMLRIQWPHECEEGQ